MNLSSIPIPTLRLIQLLVIGGFFWLPALVLPGGVLIGALFLIVLMAACWRDFFSLPSAADLTAKRAMPPRFSLGVEQTITLTIANRSQRTLSFTVRDELPDMFELSHDLPSGQLPARGAVEITYSVVPLQRGGFDFGAVVLRASGGVGLLQRQIALPTPNSVKVYPNFKDIGRYELLAKIDERDELVRKPRYARVVGTDFESLRPYIAGEDPRSIDWKATARRGTPIAKNRQIERGQQIAILLDTGRLMAGMVDRYTKLEHAMNAAVLLSYTAQKRGDALAVASFSNKVESFMPMVRGPAIVSRVLDSLYPVQVRPVESDYWQAIAEMMHLLRRRSLVVLFTDVLDASASAGLINNLARAADRHLVLCVVLSEPRIRQLAGQVPTTAAETYRKAAAADMRRRRRLALEQMRARGILVLETEPEHLSVQLVKRYLEIRQADLQ
jgi:uncharacterized protein (DUF58 family)